MNLIFDILICLIVLLCAWLGKKRGFIKTFFGFFGNIAAFILTSLLAKPLGSFLSERFFFSFLKENFLDSLVKKVGTEVSSLDFFSLPSECDEILSRFGTDAGEISSYLSEMALAGEETTENVTRWIVEPIADSVSFAVAFLGLFIVFSLAIRILVKVLDLISKLPFLNFSNRFLGLGAGLLQGIFLAVLLSSFLVIAAPAINGNENEFLRSFDPQNTVIIKFFSRFDILGLFGR